MKHILFLLPFLLFARTAAAELSNDKIYFFTYKNCPRCKLADRYIRQKHPALKIERIDIAGVQNTLLYLECAAKHGLGETAGVPLLCIGDDYIQGWGDDAPKRFDAYVKTRE